MNKIVFLVLSACISISFNVEAKRGIGSLFKIGKGIKTHNSIKNYNANTLSVEELKKCVIYENSINESAHALEADTTKISVLEKKLKEYELDIAEKENKLKNMKSMGINSESEIEKYNNNVEKFNQLLKNYNSHFSVYENLAELYESSVDSHNKTIQTFNQWCDGKRYYEEDLLLVRQILSAGQ